MEPIYFTSLLEFRSWLERYYDSESEVWVGFHRKDTGRPSLTWQESVDEALCFGWIDGVRRSVDSGRYMIRFTPRKLESVWSNRNIARAEELLRSGRMRPAGEQAYAARDAAKSGVYSFEQRSEAQLDEEQLSRLRSNPDAWRFWKSQPPATVGRRRGGLSARNRKRRAAAGLISSLPTRQRG